MHNMADGSIDSATSSTGSNGSGAKNVSRKSVNTAVPKDFGALLNGDSKVWTDSPIMDFKLATTLDAPFYSSPWRVRFLSLYSTNFFLVINCWNCNYWRLFFYCICLVIFCCILR